MLYYYIATAVGLVTLLLGAVSSAKGLIHRVVPESSLDFYVETTKTDKQGNDISLTEKSWKRKRRQPVKRREPERWARLWTVWS